LKNNLGKNRQNQGRMDRKNEREAAGNKFSKKYQQTSCHMRKKMVEYKNQEEFRRETPYDGK